MSIACVCSKPARLVPAGDRARQDAAQHSVRALHGVPVLPPVVQPVGRAGLLGDRAQPPPLRLHPHLRLVRLPTRGLPRRRARSGLPESVRRLGDKFASGIQLERELERELADDDGAAAADD